MPNDPQIGVHAPVPKASKFRRRGNPAKSALNRIGICSIALLAIAFSVDEPASTSPGNALPAPSIRRKSDFEIVLQDLTKRMKRIGNPTLSERI
jgi:hypothetical protein